MDRFSGSRSEAQERPHADAERDRLLYVAATRARDHLLVSLFQCGEGPRFIGPAPDWRGGVKARHRAGRNSSPWIGCSWTQVLKKLKYVEFPCLRDEAHLSRLAILTTFGVFPTFSLCPLKGFLSRCEWSTWA